MNDKVDERIAGEARDAEYEQGGGRWILVCKGEMTVTFQPQIHQTAFRLRATSSYTIVPFERARLLLYYLLLSEDPR
jgi:hypothetical protein